MLGVFRAVVQGQRSSCRGRKLLERPDNRLIGFGCGLPFYLGKPKESGRALGYAMQRRLAAARDQRIAFPMAKLLSLLDSLRPGINGNPIGNLGFSHFSPFSLDAPFPVCATELGDEVLPIRGIPVIDELVDRLRADRLTSHVFLETTSDDLRGPVDLELLPDVLLNLLALEQWPAMTSGQPPLARSLLSLTGCIAMILRGSIPRKLPRDRPFVPVKRPGDLGGAFPLPTHLGDELTLSFGKMNIVF